MKFSLLKSLYTLIFLFSIIQIFFSIIYLKIRHE